MWYLAGLNMSEYITIDVEPTSNPYCVKLVTNLKLGTGDPEHYNSASQVDEGSPLAQILFEINGLAKLSIEGNTLTVICYPDADWTGLIDDITSALKDFFL